MPTEMTHKTLYPDHLLSLAYAPAQSHRRWQAIFAVDAHLAQITVQAREPMVARIKLAWWREQGFSGAGQANDLAPEIELLSDILPALITLAGAWDECLAGEDEAAMAYGLALFEACAGSCGQELQVDQKNAAKAWGLAAQARMMDQAALLARAANLFEQAPKSRFPASLRPLSILVTLARVDARKSWASLSRFGSPRRMVSALAGHLF